MSKLLNVQVLTPGLLSHTIRTSDGKVERTMKTGCMM